MDEQKKDQVGSVEAIPPKEVSLLEKRASRIGLEHATK